MNFSLLDRQMRVFETNSDLSALPELYLVARLDGRSFTRLTKETVPLEAPFDIRFRELMVATTRDLMQCGFNVIYGYTESDEISLLFRKDETQFGRKLRKIISTLAGEASAVFSLRLGQKATFDCRVSQLPTMQRVVDYFRWRAADAFRNCLNSQCYWALRKSGSSATEATQQLNGMSVSRKQELLFQRFQTNFNDLPAWQKLGIGLSWEVYQKTLEGPPRTDAAIPATRRRIKTWYELPMKDDYAKMILEIIN